MANRYKHSQCSKFIPNLSSVCRQFLPSCLLPKLFLEVWLWTDTKNEETITYETAQTSALSWLKMLEYFGKYETNSPQLTGKRSSTPLDSLLILVCVSIRRMGWFWFSWLTSHARRLFRHRVNNTDIEDTSEMTCEP